MILGDGVPATNHHEWLHSLFATSVTSSVRSDAVDSSWRWRWLPPFQVFLMFGIFSVFFLFFFLFAMLYVTMYCESPTIIWLLSLPLFVVFVPFASDILSFWPHIDFFFPRGLLILCRERGRGCFLWLLANKLPQINTNEFSKCYKWAGKSRRFLLRKYI